MDVIRHQTIGLNAEPGHSGVTGEKIEVELTISVVKEDLLPSIASLRDVIRNSCKRDSGDSRCALLVPTLSRILPRNCI
jgi:hypothetical protein